MNFADNWARVFVVITFLTLGEAQIIGGIVPNLIAFGLFLGAIGYFASTGKMAKMLAEKGSRTISFDLIPDTKTFIRTKTLKKTGWQTCL
ncbi:hypothetical protein [Prochlorococcus marinus]|uniref:Uncharacterized protein n=1 Tax=Prochlorococcus marinus str. PAC1 TaxID=59924 RepID=A0A0A2C7V8_PROMR|nr:hypothetical protein [Prochlorococcus marinus]KGG22451.1 hypothetical protein EV03_0121 [Prochlorococcus marinus str. PAC1]